ncbi:carboxypeptidase M32 [Candidatus Pacearchaeota archaeon CG10_big_fil_rev_8_21_14_0_10_31_24]|nr:MAG: carboxypeptidase M32 [Candidatus Pacearchaeota archaeon CG10_big_fil_rev_8_21_14_0_10_31_24]
MGIKEDLDFVNNCQKEMVLLNKVSALLDWDQQTHMPSKGIQSRAEKIALLEGMAHEKALSEELFLVVSKLRNENLEGDSKIMIEKLYHDLLKARKIPKSFVEELARVSAVANSAWKEARDKNDFIIFSHHLKNIIELKRKESEMYGFSGHPYNCLLDDFEEGMTEEKLKVQFDKLKKGLVEILHKIENSENYKNQNLILTKKDFPKEMQMELAKDVVRRIGLEEEFSRIDFAEHPFMTGIGIGDVRITTNIREDPLFCFGSCIHEAGHALYELGMPEEHFYNLLGNEPSLGIHESQSRFWENMVGMSKEFWEFYYPKFDEKYNLGDFEQWYKEVNFVTPGKIRIESDELHYCLHIILRFEIELGLIDGSINVDDLPSIWNMKMKELFGVVPENDKEGVLQDVHWSCGYIGYFPTYALGTIYSAQLFEKLVKEIPDIKEDIRKGDFKRIGKWLYEKIHKQGRKFLAEDLINNVCGEGLNVEVYLNYLNKKYGEIYGF